MDKTKTIGNWQLAKNKMEFEGEVDPDISK